MHNNILVPTIFKKYNLSRKIMNQFSVCLLHHVSIIKLLTW